MDIKQETQTALCSVCGKLFSKDIYRIRHMRVVHKTNAKGEKITNKTFTCNICKKDFTQKKYLQAHVNIVHLANQDSSTIFYCEVCNYKTPFQQNLKKHINNVHKNRHKEESTTKFHCVYCKSKFTFLKHLKYHERKIHNVGEPLRKQVKRQCPMCSFTSSRRQRDEINKHLESQHGINLDWRSLEFTSVEEFHKWKVEIEDQSIAQYIKRDLTDTRLHYTCHRNGLFQSKSNGKRHLKTMGSCKIGAYCPSEIKVKILPNGAVQVMYLQTHVGHRNELKHIHLTPHERKLIAASLVNKTPHDEILKSIRDSVTNNEIKRIHLVNKKDIFNIKRNLNSDAVKHSIDTVNVQTWVNELNSSEDTALLLYKPQGEVFSEYPQLKHEDFFLIFMTETQKSFLITHGHDTICIDGTHNENNYSFQLYTLLILDESKEGFPVAFMFSNRKDDTVLLLFFNKLKEVFGKMNPTIFISDMEESFYSSWTTVMGPVQLRLFCTWHILKAWQNNLSKITFKKKKEEVYRILKTLVYELDIVKFNKLLDTAVTKFLADEDTKDFGNYFTEYFVRGDQYKHWAYCFRINAGIITNMSLENFNRLLKCCYLRGKQIKKVDQGGHRPGIPGKPGIPHEFTQPGNYS